ncbi:MAG: PACE efflux transporter [Rhodobacteraceae bacterium]|jgi:uncharacterized membrane protein|nr:PACE efflux transporter [Paracoccaceae bacterium]
MTLSAIQRRVLYAVLFESIGIVITTLGLLLFSDSDAATATGAAVGSMLLALLYSYLYNWIFEAWEARQPTRGRDLKRRLIHGAGYEAGLVLVLVPFLAWWMGIGLIEALIYDAGLIIFFAVYAVVFTWAFDRIFGLPESAR